MDEWDLDVNAHGVLKIPLEMWLSLAFLCRHWFLALMVTMTARRSQESVLLLGADFGWHVLTLEIPALIALLVCARRVPEAGPFTRILWSRLSMLVWTSVTLHLGYAFWYLSQSSYWLPWPELFMASCSLIDLAIGYAFVQTPRLKKILSEFPSPILQKDSS